MGQQPLYLILGPCLGQWREKTNTHVLCPVAHHPCVGQIVTENHSFLVLPLFWVTFNKWSIILIDWNLCTIPLDLFGFTTLPLIMMNSLLSKWQNYIHPAIASKAFLPPAWFWQVRSLLNMLHVACCLLLGYSFEPRLSSRAGSVMIIGKYQ